ncbi:hypothetical protein HCC61_06685 [Streptomyces sp. HNM0575]|uniref:hypothetical protein n=1 Tax=Streptomyces sp. HNM0575 TaxID=2716338 RepID=UPI00145F07E6|nr:hypothetical protein [Streptomyces sp. HNM0575]NLU72366.1 hypothetical protein [Streptomyces sp. HNM0575]
MTEPPQDRYGSPRSRGQRPPPPPVPRQPPPKPMPSRQPPPQPPTAGFGYWEADAQQLPPRPPEPPQPPPQSPQQQPPWATWEQPPWEPWDRSESEPSPPYGYDDPYGYEYRYGFGPGGPGPSPYDYARMGPQETARSKTRLTVLIVGTLIALLLAAGGVYYMVKSESGDAGGSAQNAPSQPDPAGERPAGGKSGGAQDGDGGKGSGNDRDGAGGSGNGAGQGRFTGKWRSGGGEALTIGKQLRSGKSAGKQAVSYDRPGRLSTCPGVGEVRKSGASFRLALKCVNGSVKSELGGDAVRSGGKLTVEWDGGSSDAFAKQGEKSGQKEQSGQSRRNEQREQNEQNGRQSGDG